jgi:hypothetical protein
MSKETNFHIANSTCDTRQLPKDEVKISKNSPYCVSNALEIW